METSPQSSSLFNYYNFYKVIIGLLLFGMSFTEPNFVNQFRFPELYQLLTLSYLLFNIALLFLFRFTFKTSPNAIFASLSIDIILLHTLFFSAEGISGGLANLIIISVAAGNIIIRGRIGLSFAAMATLLTFAVESERFLTGLNTTSDIPGIGLIGTMYFASAYILQYLSIRISQSEILVKQQEQDLRELEKLNHQIIQSMRTGIIVCDRSGKIKLINQACKDLIALSESEQLPKQILDRIELWQSTPTMRTTPFKVNQNSPLVQANFTRIQLDGGSEILIFIDDTRKMSQQAQQLKLASLGRLTASIAHEVRNPLGAISHATQLLAESDNLDDSDKKMTDIIQRHSKRVNQIIENTMQLSRRSEPAIKDILIKTWLEKIVSEYNLQQTPPVKLTIEQPAAAAHFDPDQLEQVLINLIDNGIRHGTKENSNASLEIKLAIKEDKQQSYIDVIDQGAGVPEESVLHLFEPFFTTESQGTGLGLYLSREICEANQAQLDLIGQSSENKYVSINNKSDTPSSSPDTQGACFRITFAHHNRILPTHDNSV